jgi:hypothetical protein
VWKHKFKILRAAPERYDIETQVGLVYATAALHNFIEKAGADGDELAQGDEGQDNIADNLNDIQQIADRPEDPEMTRKREEIAGDRHQMYIS